MKTFWAALAHVGVGALQAAAAVPFFDNNKGAGVLGNKAVQIVLQLALAALQSAIANKNSNTDPNGQKLTPTLAGGFHSQPPPENP